MVVLSEARERNELSLIIPGKFLAATLHRTNALKQEVFKVLD